jgi:hypothetical protein
MGKRIDGGQTVAWVEIDGVVYPAELRERSANLANVRRGPGARTAPAPQLLVAEVA